jgi:hypothetical protein
MNLAKRIHDAVTDALNSKSLFDLKESLLRNLYVIRREFNFCPICGEELTFKNRRDDFSLFCCSSDDCSFEIGDKMFYQRFVSSEEEDSDE